MANLKKSCLLEFHTLLDIFIHFFASCYFFHMFSTLMSLEDRLKTEISLCMAIKAEPPIAIPLGHLGIDVPSFVVHIGLLQVHM